MMLFIVQFVNRHDQRCGLSTIMPRKPLQLVNGGLREAERFLYCLCHFHPARCFGSRAPADMITQSASRRRRLHRRHLRTGLLDQTLVSPYSLGHKSLCGGMPGLAAVKFYVNAVVNVSSASRPAMFRARWTANGS